MSALLVALCVVAYFAIGTVLAGLADRHVHPEDRNGAFVVALWPLCLVALLAYWLVYFASAPFRALYRAVRGKP